jgi:putative transposase
MPRRNIPILPGIPHHVTQRAAHGVHILEGAGPKAILVDLLAEWAERLRVVIDAFVIMDNHFHLSATPPDEDALGKMLGNATQALSRWLNLESGDVGPNWQGPFYAAPMDEAHAVAAARYIERNPVAAGLVERAWDWHWSSAAFHAGIGARPRLLGATAQPGGLAPAAWADALGAPLPAGLIDSIHSASSGKVLLASADWVERTEASLGKRIRPRPRGRPRADENR